MAKKVVPVKDQKFRIELSFTADEYAEIANSMFDAFLRKDFKKFPFMEGQKTVQMKPFLEGFIKKEFCEQTT